MEKWCNSAHHRYRITLTIIILGNVIQIPASLLPPPFLSLNLSVIEKKLLLPHRARQPLFSIPSLSYNQPSSLWSKIGIRGRFGKNCVPPRAGPLNASVFTERKGQHPERREIPLKQLGRGKMGYLWGRERETGKRLISGYREQTSRIWTPAWVSEIKERQDGIFADDR